MRALLIALCLAITTNSSAETKVLAFSGSTRKDSVNKKLVLEAADLARQTGATVTVIDLKDYPLPLYDADLESEKGLPKNAKKLRKLMMQSDVILIASPEYNASVTAVLKNTIDWASRDESGNGSKEAFKDKKFVIMSASPGSLGGKRGLVHLQAIIQNLGGVVLAEQVSVPNAQSAFDAQGHLKDPKIKKQLEQVIKQAN